MADREKVIASLNKALTRAGCGDMDNVTLSEVEEAIESAIALLRDQEPVAPVEEWAWYDCYKCGACGKLWGTTYEIERWNFCPWCGRAVKWDG